MITLIAVGGVVILVAGTLGALRYFYRRKKRWGAHDFLMIITLINVLCFVEYKLSIIDYKINIV